MTQQLSPEAPERGIGTRLGLAIVGAGAVGALTLPVSRIGIGWPLTAMGLAGVIAVARLGSNGGAARGGPDRAWRIAAAVAAGALIAVAGVRAAGWLVALCLVVGTALASYALVGGTTWRGIGYGLTALPQASLASVGWVVAEAKAAGVERDADGGLRPGWRAAFGFAAGTALLFVFGALFTTADPAFADLLGWTEDITLGTIVRPIVAVVLVVAAALGAAHLLRARRGAEAAPPEVQPADDAERRTLRAAEWVIPLAMLDALFGVFVWVQVTTLFAGDEFVLEPGGPNYADYARGGFQRLVVVTVLTLTVVAVLSRWARQATHTERVLLRVFGGALCALTLVIVASALTRMGLYTQAYGFSVLRLLGFAGETWLGLVFVLILVAGARPRARWLPRAAVASGVAVLLGVAAINPEAMMARTHIDRLKHHLPLDYHYLSTLSADAAGEIDALPEPDRSCVLRWVAYELRRPEPWYRLNLGRERARELIDERPVDPDADALACDAVPPGN